MKTDKRNIIFMIVEAIFIFALILLNGKVFKVYESVILGLLLLGSSSYYLYYMTKKITHVPYVLLFCFLNAAFIFLVYQVKFSIVYNFIFVILILLYIQVGSRLIIKRYTKV